MSVQDYYAGHGLPGIKHTHTHTPHTKKDDTAGDKVGLTNDPGMILYQKQE